MGSVKLLHRDGRKSELKNLPNNTIYKRCSCHGGYKQPSKLCRNLPPQPFWASRPCGPAGWLSLLLIKADDVETNPSPTTTHKEVWICDICHKQIHGRKQISIMCNRIVHWVHLRCADIRQHNIHMPGPAIYIDKPDSQLTQHNTIPALQTLVQAT